MFMCEHPTIVEARDLFLAAAVVLTPPWPRCPLSGMLISGHCEPLAVSLSRPWSSMWPCVFVSVGTAICRVVLMWWMDLLPDILLPAAGQYLNLFDSESETDLSGDSSDEGLVEV